MGGKINKSFKFLILFAIFVILFNIEWAIVIVGMIGIAAVIVVGRAGKITNKLELKPQELRQQYIDIKESITPELKGSSIPSQQDTPDPIFYGKGTKLKLSKYLIKDPFIFYAKRWNGEDKYKEFAIYNYTDTRKETSQFFSITSGYYDSYLYMPNIQRKEFLYWLAMQRYVYQNKENQCYVELYIKGIYYQSTVLPDKSLLYEMLKLYSVYSYGTRYCLLHQIAITIEQLCFSINDLDNTDKQYVLQTLLQDSQYDIVNGMPVENENIKPKNELTWLTSNQIYDIAYYFNKYPFDTDHKLIMPIIRRQTYSLGNYCSSTLQKQSVFDVYLAILLSSYPIKELLAIQMLTATGYIYLHNHKIPKVPRFYITNKVKELWQQANKDLKPYTKIKIKTKNGAIKKLNQAERFLTLPLVLKKHFDFPKKKFVDKLYKSNTIKTGTPETFWKDLGFDDKNLTPKNIETMLETYTSMGYTVQANEKEFTIHKKLNIDEGKIQTNESEFTLDYSKLKQYQESTFISQEILHNILDKDEINFEIKNTVPADTDMLDINALVFKIKQKNTWTRNELLELLEPFKIMLNDAIDRINEFSDEEYGDILIFDKDSTYEINQDILEKLSGE